MRIELTPSAWKAEVLPLNYIRKIGAEDEIRTRDPRLGKAMLYPWATSAYLVEGDGFEPSKAQLTDLQSAPFGHSGIPRELCLDIITYFVIMSSSFYWSWWRESNPQPADYKSAALPLSHTSIFVIKSWRPGTGSNRRPPAWQAGILTNWTTRPHHFYKWWAQ